MNGSWNFNFLENSKNYKNLKCLRRESSNRVTFAIFCFPVRLSVGERSAMYETLRLPCLVSFLVGSLIVALCGGKKKKDKDSQQQGLNTDKVSQSREERRRESLLG